MSKENEVIQELIDGLTTGKSLDHLSNMIDSIDDVIIEVIDQKWALEDNMLDPLIDKMNTTLDNINKEGTLYKGTDYGTKNLEEWAWYKDTDIVNVYHVDDNTFYVNGDKRSTFPAGQYITVNYSYKKVPRRVSSSVLSGSNTYVHLSTSLSDDLWDNPYYDPNKATYPTCVDPNIKKSGCDCAALTERPYTTSSSTTSTTPEYEPGIFKIIISPISEDIQNYVVFINISEDSGINGMNLSRVFDEVGDDWRKIYIRNEDETELLYINVDYWEPENKRGALYIRVPFIEANKQTTLICRYGMGLDNNDTHIWQLKTSYPFPPGYTKEIDVENNLVYYPVWKFNSNLGYRSYMNFGCVNNWCNGKYSSEKKATLKLNNCSNDGYMHTTRHITDPNNFVERGYNNIRNALSNKDIVVNTGDWGEPVKEYISIYNYGFYGFEDGWTIEIFIKRKTPFGIKETTQEEYNEYYNTGIAGANGPHDEFLFMYNTSAQMESDSCYWNAKTGRLTIRIPKQYDNGNYEHPEYNTLIYYESNKASWSDDWTHIVYVCDNPNATVKLYVDGELDSTYNINFAGYFTKFGWYMTVMGFKKRSPGWIFKPRYANFTFMTLDNYKAYIRPLSQEEIKANYNDLKDKLCSYYNIIGPS